MSSHVSRLPSPRFYETYPLSPFLRGRGIAGSYREAFVTLSSQERVPAWRWFFGRQGGEVCVKPVRRKRVDGR